MHKNEKIGKIVLVPTSDLGVVATKFVTTQIIDDDGTTVLSEFTTEVPVSEPELQGLVAGVTLADKEKYEAQIQSLINGQKELQDKLSKAEAFKSGVIVSLENFTNSLKGVK